MNFVWYKYFTCHRIYTFNQLYSFGETSLLLKAVILIKFDSTKPILMRFLAYQSSSIPLVVRLKSNPNPNNMKKGAWWAWPILWILAMAKTLHFHSENNVEHLRSRGAPSGIFWSCHRSLEIFRVARSFPRQLNPLTQSIQ